MIRNPIVLALGLAALLAAPATAQARDANPHGSLPVPCATCHTAQSWKPAAVKASFRHADYGYPLDNAHARVNCTSCHTTLDFAKVTTTCASCHRDVHKGELGLDCASCHNTRAFTDRATFLQRHSL
ncbi:MAG: hypothetical protein JNJ80_23935, partial [Gemmatimonadetes bacterium]|nr:hypothetical protein [Gemmatimonadota bacterium]